MAQAHHDTLNRRVLAQARDTSTPLLERLKFLCISSSNLDEFYEIRVLLKLNYPEAMAYISAEIYH